MYGVRLAGRRSYPASVCTTRTTSCSRRCPQNGRQRICRAAASAIGVPPTDGTEQGRYLPGTRIPILAPDRIRETRPDYVLILPWNLKEEIAGQMSDVRSWGGKFVVAIPEVRVFE